MNLVMCRSSTQGWYWPLNRHITILYGHICCGEFPGSSSGYSDCFEAFELVADASISDCGGGEAWSCDIVFGILSSSIVTASVMDARMQYGPRVGRISLEYESVSIRSGAVTATGELSV